MELGCFYHSCLYSKATFRGKGIHYQCFYINTQGNINFFSLLQERLHDLASRLPPFQNSMHSGVSELFFWDSNCQELPLWGSPPRTVNPRSTFSYPKASNSMSPSVCHDGKTWKRIFNRLGTHIRIPLALISELPTPELWQEQLNVLGSYSHLENPMKSYRTSVS